MDGGAANGATQMSVDAALQQNPSRTGIPTVRVYHWKPFCISLGFHQDGTSIDYERCRQHNVDVVRRPTGGRAVFHADEVTYAVVIPRDSEWVSESKHTLYRLISEGLTKGLVLLNLPVVFAKRSADLKSPADRSASLDCFTSTARWEITLQGKKLAGSAQRLSATGFLQHGSILTGDGHRRLSFFIRGQETHPIGKPSLIQNKSISIEEYDGRKTSYETVTDSLRKGFEAVFSVRLEKSGLTEEESALADSIRNRFSIFQSGKSG
jgi:lipoate-protein ligase A